MERLLDYRFEWVLPGHGRIHHAARRRDARASRTLRRVDEADQLTARSEGTKALWFEDSACLRVLRG